MRDTAHCYMCKRYKHKGDFYGDVSRKSGVSSRCIKCEARRTIQRELDGEWERRYEMRRDRRRGFGITNYGTGYSVERISKPRISQWVELQTYLTDAEWYRIQPKLSGFKYRATRIAGGYSLKIHQDDFREARKIIRFERAHVRIREAAV